MPLRDLICQDCGHVMEDILVQNQGDLDAEFCCKCESKKLQIAFSSPSTYFIKGDNSASVRPKRMGGK